MIKVTQLILSKISTNASVVLKNAVPYWDLPFLSDPFKKDETRIPKEIIAAIMVKGIGSWIFPAEMQTFFSGRVFNGQVLTQLFLYKK